MLAGSIRPKSLTTIFFDIFGGRKVPLTESIIHNMVQPYPIIVRRGSPVTRRAISIGPAPFDNACGYIILVMSVVKGSYGSNGLHFLKVYDIEWRLCEKILIMFGICGFHE